MIRVREVTKRFGRRAAVDRVSFEARPGEVTALLGPNGAGKTTTVRMLVGILGPDEGEVTLGDGLAPDDPRVRARVGYLPEDRGLYREIPVMRTLTYFGVLRGLGREGARARARAWLERMGLADRAEERLDALSKGNQQRVQFAAAVLHDPDIAILDEPFSGLDPLSQDFMLGLVGELRDRGATVVLSAHQMELVERAADRAVVVNHGRCLLSGSMDDLRKRLADGSADRLHDVFVRTIQDDDRSRGGGGR